MNSDRTHSDSEKSNASDLNWRLAFLEHWRTELTSQEALIQHGDRVATDLALAALRSGYLLNGGAVVALPAFLQIFKPAHVNQSALVASVLLFVLGLISCAIANYVGYTSSSHSTSAQVESRKARAINVRELYYPSQDRLRVAKTTAQLTEESERLFARARVQLIAARTLFIVSLGCFIVGCLVSFGAWLGIEGESVMQIVPMIIELAKVLAWPAVVVLVILVLRQPLTQLLTSLTISRATRAAPPPPGQEDAAEPPSTQEQIRRAQEHPDPIVERQSQTIRKHLDEAEPALQSASVDRETALIQALAMANIREHFERTYISIWGSQITTLQHLNSVGEAPESALRPIYERMKSTYPDVYSRYTFEHWLGFLQAQLLIDRRDGKASITPEGAAFLKYLIDRKYTLNKAW